MDKFYYITAIVGMCGLLAGGILCFALAIKGSIELLIDRKDWKSVKFKPHTNTSIVLDSVQTAEPITQQRYQR